MNWKEDNTSLGPWQFYGGRGPPIVVSQIPYFSKQTDKTVRVLTIADVKLAD